MSRKAHQLFFVAVLLIAAGLIGVSLQPETQNNYLPDARETIVSYDRHITPVTLTTTYRYTSPSSATAHPINATNQTDQVLKYEDALDKTGPTMVPWSSSEQCRKWSVSFAKRGSFPMTALASFPGSGNTWFRYLIQGASGIFTGSVYRDAVIYKKGFPGELATATCGCTIAQKTHGFSASTRVPQEESKKMAMVKRFNGRGILLMRNPYEAILAFRNYNYAGHTGHAAQRYFQGPGWEAFVARAIVMWREFATTWINGSLKGIAVHFEDLRSQPRAQLEKTLRFLQVPIMEDRMACLLEHLNGEFKRTARPKNDLGDPYSMLQHSVIDKAIDDLNAMLEKKKWTTMPLKSYKYYKNQS